MAGQSEHVLGIDQGSTHTRALVADPDGRLLGVGRAAGACHASSGMKRAMAAVREAADAALAHAGIAGADEAIVDVGPGPAADWVKDALGSLAGQPVVEAPGECRHSRSGSCGKDMNQHRCRSRTATTAERGYPIGPLP